MKIIVQGIWEAFLYENNRNYDFCKFNYKFAVIPFLSFRKNQNQESNLQKVGGVVRRNVSALYL